MEISHKLQVSSNLIRLVHGKKAWIEQTDSLALGHNTCLETGKAWTYNDFVRSKVVNKDVTESFCKQLFLQSSQRCHKTSYPMKPTEINLFKICHIKWSYFASIKQSTTNGISCTNSASLGRILTQYKNKSLNQL